MKRFALAVALACVLSASAVAGDSSTAGEPAPGEIPSTGAPAPATESSDVLTTVILAILSVVS